MEEICDCAVAVKVWQPTQHLCFGHDANNTRWTSAGGPGSGVVGWLNTKMYEQTGDGKKSQGWTPLIPDTNGNGKRDEYTEANQPFDPKKDRRIMAAFYGVHADGHDHKARLLPGRSEPYDGRGRAQWIQGHHPKVVRTSTVERIKARPGPAERRRPHSKRRPETGSRSPRKGQK